MSWIADLTRRLVRKSQPGSSSVHVAVPLGSEEEKVRKDDMNPPFDNLEATIIKAALSAEARSEIKPSNFAEPETRSYPIHDESHARNALARSSGKPEEARVKAAVYRKYPALKPEVKKDDAPAEPQPGERRIATVAIQHGNHMLMGKRRDNGKWTVPGGHVDPGETMHQGALREVEEESGLQLAPGDVQPLGEMVSKTAHGGTDTIHVQPYVAKLAKRPTTTMKDDPDGEVHRWNWVDVSKGLPAHIHKALHVPAESNVLLQRLGLAGEEAELEEPGSGEEEETDENDAVEWTEQQALGEVVSGIDWEKASDPELSDDQAREKALENLEEDPGYYRNMWSLANADTPEDAFDDDGMNIDLGSGHARAPGYVGVDLYPYDHGTVVHDVSMGLPFDDQCATTVRLVNALHEMDGVDSSELMDEVARVLMPGGQFVYEGPDELPNESPLMLKTAHTQGVAKDATEPPTWHKMAFTRVVEPDAATANDSESRSAIPQASMIPADQLLATDALSYYWSDAGTSAAGNHAAGYASQGGEPAEHGISKGGPGSGPHPGGGAKTQEEHKAEYESKVPPAHRIGSDFHSGGHTREGSRELAQGLRDKGVYASVAHVSGPKTGPKSNYAVTTLSPKVRHSGVAKVGRILGRGKTVPIAKLSKAKQIVYCVVLSPNESDEQEDFCTPEDIEEACHFWMLKSQVVGAEHSRQINAKPVENYIAPCDFEMTGPFGPQKVVKGAWVVGLKIFDAKEWEKIEDGDYQGVSLGGEGIRDPMAAIPA